MLCPFPISTPVDTIGGMGGRSFAICKSLFHAHAANSLVDESRSRSLAWMIPFTKSRPKRSWCPSTRMYSVRGGFAIAQQKSMGTLGTDPLKSRLRHGVTVLELQKRVLQVAIRRSVAYAIHYSTAQ